MDKLDPTSKVDDLEDGEIETDDEEAKIAPTLIDSSPIVSKSRKRRKKKILREIDSDEEKKRILKAKLKQLERQMAGEEFHEDEDDEFCEDEEDEYKVRLFTDGGSPKRFRSNEHDDEEERSSYDSEESRVLLDKNPSQRRAFKKYDEVCKMYMQGKCPKSTENCLFSHDAEPPKIMELCKFYLFERCAKREKCLYLHKGFPCKYFHTGHRCLDTPETCKFSHEHLNDVTRAILLKHLEAAPNEILGDFPRLSRDIATSLVFANEAKNKRWFEDCNEESGISPLQEKLALISGTQLDIDVAKKRKSRWESESRPKEPPPQSSRQNHFSGVNIINYPESGYPPGYGDSNFSEKFYGPEVQGFLRERREIRKYGNGPSSSNSNTNNIINNNNNNSHSNNYHYQQQQHSQQYLPSHQQQHNNNPHFGPPSRGMMGRGQRPSRMMIRPRGGNPRLYGPSFRGGDRGNGGNMVNSLRPLMGYPPRTFNIRPLRENWKSGSQWSSLESEAPPPPHITDSKPILPQAQMRLYERIQQKQREENNILSRSGVNGPVSRIDSSSSYLSMKGDSGRKDEIENWYSSEEEEGTLPFSKDHSSSFPFTSFSSDVSVSRDPRMNRNEKSELLDMSVFGDLMDLPPLSSKEDTEEDTEKEEKDHHHTSSSFPFSSSSISSSLSSSSYSSSCSNSNREIDASLYSHSPLVYTLSSIRVIKPDYSDILAKQQIPSLQISQDPRLIRYNLSNVDVVYNPIRDLKSLESKNSNDTSKKVSRDPRRRD